MLQTTIARTVSYTGVGLHSGKDVQMRLQPAPADSGIVFYVHTPSGVRHIAPRPSAVSATALATTLSDGQASVSTVEHVLAALAGMAVDNVQVHVFGGEIPIMDGSAVQAAALLKEAGLRSLHAPRRVARVRRPLSVAGDGKAIHVWPHNGFYVDYTIDFPHASIGKQRLSLEITPDTFAEIAFARTFGGVEHRIELVRELDGVRWYNDSIASSPTRTIAGLNSFQQKVILIAGGYDKHIPYDVLGQPICDHVKLLLLTGATAPKIRECVENIEGEHPPIIEVENLETAVQEAAARAESGDVVIMSPASASFDRFKNFMERGKLFKALVEEL